MKTANVATLQTRHARAFAFVDPSERVKQYVKSGQLTAEQAARVTWKDRICSIVTEADLAAQGLGIDDVARAIEFYTATIAKVTIERIAPTNELGYLVLADGYRNGPAGP